MLLADAHELIQKCWLGGHVSARRLWIFRRYSAETD